MRNRALEEKETPLLRFIFVSRVPTMASTGSNNYHPLRIRAKRDNHQSTGNEMPRGDKRLLAIISKPFDQGVNA